MAASRGTGRRIQYWVISMVRVLFFASYREALGVSEYSLALDEGDTSLALLKQRLIQEKGQAWQQVLEANNLVQAVNQTVVDDSSTVKDGDEVAFFPPVTGG